MSLEVTTNDVIFEEKAVSKLTLEPGQRKYHYVLINAIVFGYYHVAALYGLYLLSYVKWETLLFNYIIFWITSIGIFAGSHRLWSHRSYKATKPLQIFLMLAQCLSNQHTVYKWVRVHHKYSDTDADPYNATRGFFFSHIGWLMVRKHPDVKMKGKLIDVSDITGNSVLMFQQRNANWLIPLIAFVLPTWLPVLIFSESLSVAWHINMFRFITNLNVTFLVNSAAHKYGYRPYDKSIVPSQNFGVALLTLGEGFHNYHHVFPYDYRASELGNSIFNPMTMIIDMFAWFGLAYDLKRPTDDVIRAVASRSGDGSAGYKRS